MDKIHLFTNGDSNTYGSELLTNNSWPVMLSKKLNCTVDNYAFPGSSNDKIIRETTDYVVNNLNKWVYMPFGAGPRMCIGNAFAMMESQIILSIISKQFQLNLRREIPVEFESGITLRPKNEMLMDVIKR